VPEASEAVLCRLEGLYPKAIDLSLARIERLLAALGHPERRLGPVVHVAGTNGKGSLIAFLRAILKEAGLSVHAYTSPHLISFHERICVNGAPIGEARLSALLEECERVNAGHPITFFEITTAAAFLAFARAKADATLLETGLGGRLDATNLARPILTAITPLSLDHTRFLGPDLAAIAAEKAGIFKPGVVAVVGCQPGAALSVLRRRAQEVGAPFFAHGSEWSTERRGAGFRYRGRRLRLDLPAPALAGDHQIDNAGLALACIENLDALRIPESAIARGLARAIWPGRLQRLTKGRLADALGRGFELWVDGGHNEAAAKAIAAWAEDEGSGPLHLLCGMMKGKDAAAFFRALAPVAASLQAVPIMGEANALPPEALCRAAREAGIEARSAGGPAAALAEIGRRHGGMSARPSRVLVCGSLYLVGRVLVENEESPAGGR
jgi:dihydrofolate synthase/folylpolyglutamate synthase